jgi:hypothetical protein
MQRHFPDEQAATKLIHFLFGAAIVVAIVLGLLGVSDKEGVEESPSDPDMGSCES